AEFLDTLQGLAWGLPLIFLLLAAGMLFTFRLGFLQLRSFVHAIAVITGRYDDPEKEGDITHFQALCAALSATVGVGNIAGVATALHHGGPGAIFWMWVAGFFGMATKFATCTLSQKFRKVNPDGSISGGPMYYIQIGLGPRFKWLALLFALTTVVASFGGGNMVQSSEMTRAATEQVATWMGDGYQESFLFRVLYVPPGGEESEEPAAPGAGEEQVGAADGLPDGAITPLRICLGLLVSTLVGLVIIGGIRRIGRVAAKLVPSMAILYCTGALFILLANFDRLIPALDLIVREAFHPTAAAAGTAGAGFLAVLTWGIKRAVFSNEAGLGSAPIAHAAAKTDEPVREGLVAMVGPFIDTLVICTMTALVILVATDLPETKLEGARGGARVSIDEAVANPSERESASANPENQGGGSGPLYRRLDGSVLTKKAFERGIPWGNGAYGALVVALGLVLFAISTAISWSYYGDRCVEYLVGPRAIMPYRWCFVSFLFMGAVVKIQSVWDFADFTMATMAFWNLIGVIGLSGVIIALTRDYMGRDHQPYR
ncbi:MAG: alanine/glycine:cation symporter family protein, partial [Planctomycetota bacterium]